MLADFAAPNAFVLNGARDYLAKHGITVAGKRYPVTIITRDTQSSDTLWNTMALTSDLVTKEQPDLVLALGHGRTVIPVANACENLGIPCLSTMAPWQAWMGTKGGGMRSTPFTWAHHFFWGRNDLIALFADMWSQMGANKVVGELLGNDLEGSALASHSGGFPPAVTGIGYKLVDPGRFDATTIKDYSAQISSLKSGKAEILTAAGTASGLSNFWKQAHRLGYVPKMATIGEALYFPSSIAAFGSLANNLSCEIWWTPAFPFSSSLTGQSAAQYASAYTSATRQQWTQPLGYTHALFEVAIAALNKSAGLDPHSISASLASLKMNTLVGPVDMSSGPVKNLALTPLVGGQWRTRSGRPPELVITSNKKHPNIPQGGTLQQIRPS